MSGITPFDHELIERTRKINKTLSMFVFTLQEGRPIAVEGQLGIASLLDELADTIRARAAGQPSTNHNGQIIDGNGGWPPELGPACGTNEGS